MAKAGFLTPGSAYSPRLPTFFNKKQWQYAGFVLCYSGGTVLEFNEIPY